MADIELVIKISEEQKKMVDAIMELPPQVENDLVSAIRHGTPLPKGHGRLGDLDIILNKAMKHRKSYMEAENSSYCRGNLHAYELYVEEVENAPIIIEADKGE